MINLLPPDIKENYRYARRNTRLLHWAFAFGFACLGLVVLSVGGAFYLHQIAKSYDSQIATQEASLKVQNQADIEKQVTGLSNDLKLAVQVLGKEVLFSELIKHMATIIPGNVSLSGLTISQVNGALDITAQAADYNAGTQLQVNLADPTNKLFSRADIVSITCKPSDEVSNRKYPCDVSIRALFTTNNPFLFINNQAVKK